MLIKEDGCQCNYRPPRDEEGYKPYPNSKDDMETIVKCGMGISPGPLCRDSGILVGGASSIPGGGCNHEAPVIASVVLDTRNLKDPIVKIVFSSLISFKAYSYVVGGYYLRLAFKLSKVCDGGNPVPLGIWTFEKSEVHSTRMNDLAPTSDGNLSVQKADSFCFTWCQCEGCPGCCTYMVELVDQDCYNIEFAAISNIFITGIASGLKRY